MHTGKTVRALDGFEPLVEDQFGSTWLDGLHDVQSGSWVVQNGIDQDFEVRESKRPSVCTVKDCQSGVYDRLQALGEIEVNFIALEHALKVPHQCCHED